jgi:hypothetical protein
MKNTPSAEQALMFDQFVQKWQTKLSLGDWRIERGMRPAKNAMASVEFNDGARLAVYRLGDFGAEPITPQSLEKTALHELLHILLHDLIVVASDHRSTDEQLEAAEHRVINVLERVLTME